jgi:hypothetical protein
MQLLIIWLVMSIVTSRPFLTVSMYIITVVVPLGVLLPIGIYSSGSTKAALVAIGIIGPVLALCWVFGYDSFSEAMSRAQEERRHQPQPQAINAGSSNYAPQSNQHDAEMASIQRERDAAQRARAELEALRRENDELERRLKREQDDLNRYSGPPSGASAPAYSPYTGTGQVPVAYAPYGSAAVVPGYGAPASDYAAPPSYDHAEYPAVAATPYSGAKQI